MADDHHCGDLPKVLCFGVSPNLVNLLFVKIKPEDQMKASTYYMVNSQRIIHENLDGEQVLIDLVSGNYFSFSRVGVAVWDLLEKQLDRETIVSVMAKHYPGDEQSVTQHVSKFIDDLVQEEIIVPAPQGCPADEISVAKTAGETLEFEPPVLNKYTDMNELLLVDPIHDVSASGWPHQKHEK